MCKPRVLYLPTPSHTKRVFTEKAFRRLMERFDVTLNEAEVNYTTEQVAQKIRGFDGLVTGWGTPPLTEQVFENADRLGIVAHSAGSVKWMLSGDVVKKYIVPRGICVFSANQAIAYNVAESTIGLLIMASHRFMNHALAIREKEVWRDPSIPGDGQFLMGSTVGIVAASKVGREVVRLLKPFDVEMLVYDPYLSDWEAGRLGVKKAELDDLFSHCDFVTIHAPLIPETEGMIGAKQLKFLKDGAVLVNTSRGKVIDHQALIEELKTGRFLAALDVTDPEPLPQDSLLRKMPNVIITPHISGSGNYGYFKIGSSTLQALEDFFAGKTPEGAINFDQYVRIA